MPDLFLIEGESIPHRERYVHEILRHAGLFYETAIPREARPPFAPIVLVAAERLPSDLIEALMTHVREGGALLCLGHTAGLDAALGVCAPEPASEGWLALHAPAHPALRNINAPLHVFGGTTVAPQTATELASLNGRAAVTWNPHGRGVAALLGADVPGSVLHIQQGIRVEKDGVPAPDGTASLDDGILKAEDGLVLDWERDRGTACVPRGLFPGSWGDRNGPKATMPQPDEPHPFRLFREPVADGLRGLFLKTLFALAEATSVPLTLLWYWPRGLDAVAHLSHDSDGNDPALAEALRDICIELDIRSTWCILYPGGYPPAFYARLRKEGFENALHFDALPNEGARRWSREALAVQAQWFRDMTGETAIRSNKNHYTRWEGRLDFFRWCEEEGIRLDESKGPSKTGTIGFPFGTAHPWFPLDDESESSRFLDVVELGLMTQDLVVTAPAAYAEVLTDAARKHYGVAHFLYHPAHILKEGVADSLRRLDSYVRDVGMEWWTADAIRHWEDLRRSVRLEADTTLIATRAVPDATLLRLLTADTPPPGEWATVERYGFRFAQRIGTLEGTIALS